MNGLAKLIPIGSALFCGTAIGWVVAFVTPGGHRDNLPSAETPLSATASAGPSADNSAEASDGASLSPDSPEFLHELRAALSLTGKAESEAQLSELVDRLDLKDFPKAYLAAQGEKGALHFRMVLVERWAKLDPQGAATFCAEHNAEQNILGTIAASWTKAAPQDAIAWLKAIEPQPGHGELTLFIMNVSAVVGQNDPHAALELWNGQKQYAADWVKENFTGQLYMQWAARDPDMATAAALALRGAERDGILAAVAEGWARKDAQASLAWASHLQNSATKKTLTRNIAMILADSDPSAAIAWTQNSGDDSWRETILDKAFAKLAEKDVSAALAASANFPAGREHDGALSQVAKAMAKTDPTRAAQLLEQIPAGAEHNVAATAIAAAMSKSDPRAGLDWVIEHGSLFNLTHNAVVLHQWYNGSPDEALAWARALPTGENRDAAFGALANGLARANPDEAMAFFSELTPEGQEAASRDLAKRFFERGPAMARQWAESLPPGDVQATALGEVAGAWYKQDPEAVTQWLTTLPSGQGKDSALSACSDQLSMTDPAKAMTCAFSIENELDRYSEIDSVAKRWMRTDTAAARNWINQSSELSDAQKTRLLNRLP